MTDYSELIKKLRDLHRDPRPASAEWLFENQVALYDAAAAIEAAEQRISDLEDDLMSGAVREPERFGINGYSMKDLFLFAEMCKRNDVKESDLKQAAWNLELAVRAVMNERQEIIKNAVGEITMRCTPDFEKAFKEMRDGANMEAQDG